MKRNRKKNTEGELLHIPVESVKRNPYQPRTVFEEGALTALSESIRKYGVLQPISVRKSEEGYELIAGERRLRAAIAAGMKEIPALVYAVDGEASAELAIMENLLREDLTLFESAAAIERLIKEFALTQEEIASRLSVSQSYVANKLRLLRLDEKTRERILSASLTERHARALLRLPSHLWEAALDRITKDGMNVAAAERLVEEMLAGNVTSKKPRKAKMRGVLRDLRLFYNSIDHALSIMRRSGIEAQSQREETENEIRLVISIPVPEGKRGA